jgi:Flavin reductase like domain
VPEVVVHIVSYAMVQQISLASTEYPKGVNEFIKAGFTQVPSLRVKPPRVKEAPVAFECRVLQVVPTGTEGGAGNLVICEVLSMYIKDQVLDKDGRIDPTMLDAVARLGGDWYCRVSGDSLFKIPKPLEKLGIGFDQLPENILKSKILTGNDLGKLSNVERVPEDHQLDEQSTIALQRAILQGEEAVHKLAQEYLEQGRVEQAWKILQAGS